VPETGPPGVDQFTARIAHQIPGRVRLRLEGITAGTAGLERLADAIAAIPGVRRVDIRTDTGSILIRHAGVFDPILESLVTAGLDVLPRGADETIDPIGDVVRELGSVGRSFDAATDGKMDFWSVAFLGLVGLGLWQLANGRVAGPALTVLGQAATIAMARPYRPARRK